MMLSIDETRGTKCNNFKAHNKWTKKIKIMNNLLPTLDIMKERYGDIIIYTKCLFCEQEQESLVHLTMCHSLNNTWNSIVDITLKNARKEVKKYLGVDISIELLKRTILSKESNIYKKTGNLLTDLIRGFIPKFLSNKLGKKLKVLITKEAF